MLNHFISVSGTPKSSVNGMPGQTAMPRAKSSVHAQRGARLRVTLGSTSAERNVRSCLRPSFSHKNTRLVTCLFAETKISYSGSLRKGEGREGGRELF